MPSTDPNVRSVSCPGCGAHYDFPAQMSGQKGRCAQCGTKFIVPAPAAIPAAHIPPPSAPLDEPAEPQPEHVGFECHLCQTRMYARVKDVGKKMKCPDCHALTVIPPPPPPKKKNMPAALEGEQYELWEPDAAPLPAELVAHQSRYIAVACSRCTTLMYARENQVGQTLTCPDCDTPNVVRAPPKPNPKVSVLAPDALTPKIDPAADPGQRPSVEISPRKKMIYEELQEAAYEEALEKSRRTGKPMEIDVRGRPILPRWPLITGIVPFLFSRGVPGACLGLAVAYFGALTLLLYGIQTAMSGGLGAIAGMCFFAIGCVLTMVCSAAASSVLLAIIMESSEGNREVQHWPGFQDWFGNLLPVAVAGMVSAMPGFFVAKLIDQFNDLDPLHAGLGIAGSALVFFPLVLMSQLDINSPWGVLSGRVLRSMATCPFSWLLFYLELALIAAVCGAATYFLAGSNPNSVLWLLPLYSVALILFGRLLGRLGWRLADAMPARE